MDRNARSSNSQRPRLVGATFLIVAGVLLFLANLGFLPVRDVWHYWPLVFVAIGFSRISCGRPGAVLSGLVFIVLGSLFTLINTGILRVHMHDGSWPLSLLFLALGIGGLAKVMDNGRKSNLASTPQASADAPPLAESGIAPPVNTSTFASNYQPDMAPALDNYIFLGSVKRKVESQSFQGGKLNCMLGSIEVDLRRARMPLDARAATIDLSVFMGTIELRVPETWRVTWNGDNVMSSVEDRTIPPITGGDAPQLFLTGSTILGNIEIES